MGLGYNNKNSADADNKPRPSTLLARCKS